MSAIEQEQVEYGNLNLDDNLCELIIKALNKVTSPRSERKAAKLVGYSERSLFRLMAKFEIIKVGERWYAMKHLRQ